MVKIVGPEGMNCILRVRLEPAALVGEAAARRFEFGADVGGPVDSQDEHVELRPLHGGLLEAERGEGKEGEEDDGFGDRH